MPFPMGVRKSEQGLLTDALGVMRSLMYDVKYLIVFRAPCFQDHLHFLKQLGVGTGHL